MVWRGEEGRGQVMVQICLRGCPIIPGNRNRYVSDCSTHIVLQHTDEKNDFVFSLLLESLIASISEDPSPRPLSP